MGTGALVLRLNRIMRSVLIWSTIAAIVAAQFLGIGLGAWLIIGVLNDVFFR